MNENNFGPNVHIMDHPLVAHKLTIMRDKNTSVKDFRELVSEIGMLITYEATRDLPMTTKHIETPICEMDAPTLAGKKFAVVPILRAVSALLTAFCAWSPLHASATSACSATRRRSFRMCISAKCRRTLPSATF